jgi:hypothetical protein
LITPQLERVLQNFSSYANIIGRSGYSKSLQTALILPEPQRTNQLNILKASISELLNINNDDSEFRNFISKYDLKAPEIFELIEFLGEDFGFKFFSDTDDQEYVTVSSFFKKNLGEKLFDKLSLFVKLKFGKKYWEEIEYTEYSQERINGLLDKLYKLSPVLANYVYAKLV